MDAVPKTPAPTPDDALASFERSHVNILQWADELRALQREVARGGADAASRAGAASVERFFRDVVLEHHEEEERDLFPVLRRAAGASGEAAAVAALVARLEREHDELEAAWRAIEPAIRKIARGRVAELDAAAVARLADAYPAHARFEEREVIALARRLFDVGDEAALSIALAMRRHPIHAYI